MKWSVPVAAWAIACASQAAATPACPTALAGRLFPTLMTGGSWTAGSSVQRMLEERQRRASACRDAACEVAATEWTPTERDLLAAASDGDPSLRATTAREGERPSDAVAREIDGLNGILEVYAGPRAPLYPTIDGPDDVAGSPARAAHVEQALSLAPRCRAGASLRDSGVGLAAALLTVNDRLDAVAFTSDRDMGRRVRDRLGQVDWSKYRYSALVVLGIGPEDPMTRLSAAGEENVRVAAERYRENLAPLIVVTGGSVHPRRTHFVEAVEMRRALTERYGVPDAAVVIEPYARHTTTNLRNVARRLIEIGAPLDRDVLILTNADQSRSISAPAFAARNQRELGYQPGAVVSRISPTELSYRLSERSLRVDPRDPLDP